MIELAQPDLTGNEERYVADCVRSGWISSHGQYIGLFEDAFARVAGSPHAVATSSGTTALHLALLALGVSPGDEVVVPTVTYIATANAVSYCGARPVLVDVEPGTLSIDVAAARRAIGPHTKGIIAVHLYGMPADVRGLRRLCDERGLFLLEDAAEAHGATVGSQPVGSVGNAAIFSFFGNKIVTSGEGGMVTTADRAIADRVRSLRGQAVDPDRAYWFSEIGYNYRMTNLQAAIGLAQTERIDAMLSRRRELHARYAEGFADSGAVVELPRPREGTTPVPWLFLVYLVGVTSKERDGVIDALGDAGIDSRPTFHPLHILPPYRTVGDFPVADDWSGRGISLPLHSGLTNEDVDTVVSALLAALVHL